MKLKKASDKDFMDITEWRQPNSFTPDEIKMLRKGASIQEVMFWRAMFKTQPPIMDKAYRGPYNR